MSQYPKGDARRLFNLLIAIDELDRPTLTTLTERTGHNKGTIQADIEKLREQYDVKITKNNAVYKLDSWGSVLKKTGVKNILNSACKVR